MSASRKFPSRLKQAALYARVSTEEQTKGLYPSCDSQIEELEAYCRAQGWEIHVAIKDEGYSAGSLKRPGLARLRRLIETRQVDVVLCTWYDRFTRSREFYIIDKELKTHNVNFLTLHDRADRATASGRFMEMMLVAAKTYEREQTGEKVRSKMRQRAEKGMWNGGAVPFGFTRDLQTQIMLPDPAQSKVVNQLFRVYVKTRSDFAVRDWLKNHQVPTRQGRPIWAVSTIRNLLCNRRYIAEIEVNRHNKGVDDLPEAERYRIVPAPHAPIVPVELFELAQAIREEKAQGHPDQQQRLHKSRNYGRSKCGRIYPLQGILTCGHCGSPMTTHYVHHKAGRKWRTDAYICYYVCSWYHRYGTNCDHRNRILARTAEAWVLERVQGLVGTDNVIEQAVEQARFNSQSALQPQQDELALTRAALDANQKEIDTLVNTITSGTTSGALLGFLNQRAQELQFQREQLQAEQRRLVQELSPLENHFDAAAFRSVLRNFAGLLAAAEPEELQQLLRLLVRRVDWKPDGRHQVQFYTLPLPPTRGGKVGFELNVRSGTPRGI